MISLAQGLAASGRPARALGVIEQTLALVQANGDLLYLPEVLRTKGTILADPAIADLDAAEACYRQSLAVARRQSALAWELRTATSFAELRAAQEKPAEAVALLSPVHRRFTQGFGSRDLRVAEDLLARLNSLHRRDAMAAAV